MKIKTLTQRGKYTLLAGVLGMTSIPSSAIPTGMADVSLPTVAQQTAKIKGKVLDARTGEPVIGANVVVKGTTNGSITNFDGEYELTAPWFYSQHLFYWLQINRSESNRWLANNQIGRRL